MAEVGGGLIGKLGRIRRSLALALVAGASPFLFGCFGQFPLTRTVYRVNDGIPTGILRNVVFWVFCILPVYSGAALVDTVVLNVLEFWFGLKIDASSTTDEDGRTVVLEPSEDGREALLTILKDGVVIDRVRFVRVSETVCEVRDADGNLSGKAVRTPQGELQLIDAQGRFVGAVTAEDLVGLRGT